MGTSKRAPTDKWDCFPTSCSTLLGLRRCLLCGACPLPRVLQPRVPAPHGPQRPVPEDEKGLGEVGLDPPALMVDVVVGGVVARDVLQRIPRQGVPAVVVDRLDHAAHEEPHSHSGCHEGRFVGEARTDRVHDERFHRVVVQSSVRVGNVQAVVSGMPVC